MGYPCNMELQSQNLLPTQYIVMGWLPSCREVGTWFSIKNHKKYVYGQFLRKTPIKTSPNFTWGRQINPRQPKDCIFFIKWVASLNSTILRFEQIWIDWWNHFISLMFTIEIAELQYTDLLCAVSIPKGNRTRKGPLRTSRKVTSNYFTSWTKRCLNFLKETNRIQTWELITRRVADGPERDLWVKNSPDEINIIPSTNIWHLIKHVEQ